MTLEEALGLREGSYVCHVSRLDYRKDGTPVRAPMRVTKTWVNGTSSIVLLRIASVGHDQWLDAFAYELPPIGQVYDKHEFEWVTPAEMKARKKERRDRISVER